MLLLERGAAAAIDHRPGHGGGPAPAARPLQDQGVGARAGSLDSCRGAGASKSDDKNVHGRIPTRDASLHLRSGALPGPLFTARPWIHRLGAEDLATPRRPVRHAVVTRVSGTRCYLCVRVGLDNLNLGGRGRIRTSVLIRGQIYSLLPLTTRPPFHRGRPATLSDRGRRKRVSVLGTGGRAVNTGRP